MGKLAAAAPLLQHHLILQGRSITLVGKCGLARCDFLGILWPKIASLFFFLLGEEVVFFDVRKILLTNRLLGFVRNRILGW
jgi:hypothetical protein